MVATGRTEAGEVTSDTVPSSRGDPLDIRADVRAFARMICLEQATPPLSICLLGEWGSGKSTFMEGIQSEVKRLTALPPEDHASPAPAEDEPNFVDDIVQIRFNAWHFADANLWASLTAVFFDQLRRGGHDGGRQRDYQELITKVADKVRSLEASAAQAAGKVDEAKRKLETANAALTAAEKQLAASELALAWDQLQADFETIRNDNQAKLKEIGRRVYRDDLAADTKTFAAAVADAASAPGKLALIGRILIGGGPATWLGIVAILAIGWISVVLPAFDTTDAATLYQRIGAWGAGTFAALGALWQTFRMAKPIMDGAWKYAKAVEAAREKAAKDLETKRKQAAEAAAALTAAEAELATSREPLTGFLHGQPADAPATILRYFLFEDSDVRDYDKHVGIVSRARRSFEQLDAIVATARLGRKADEKSRQGKKLSKDEAALRDKWLATGDGSGLRVPDRIVLYIDDLDRCTHDQVYAVLQAIHLLLSFELFVVVVGVDVRWIEAAIARSFDKDGAAGNDAPHVPSIARRKQALDYLEKIFQIAFWLERLTPGNGTAEGSYGAYVRTLLKENERATPGPSIFKSVLASTSLRLDADFARKLAMDELEAPDGTVCLPDEPLREEEEFGAVSAALASLKLEKQEVELLASPLIGALACQSPRAVKRLVNMYRIVRARLSDRELEQFLGRSDGPPRYPIVTLLAAIETGQPLELAELFYPALDALPRAASLAEALPDAACDEAQTQAAFGGMRAGYDLLKQAIALEPALATAIRTLDKQHPQEFTVEVYSQMARRVRRYSFKRSY
uniref:KAP P-loop domain protein n=1 Tax=Rhodopseudomonas palustris (strain DX-1) TaxID=652103 RepID=E6VKW9_RHOPX